MLQLIIGASNATLKVLSLRPCCFSRILERIMYNRLFKYLTTNEILYKKQFGFQKGHSTEHAIIKLIDQINYSF